MLLLARQESKVEPSAESIVAPQRLDLGRNYAFRGRYAVKSEMVAVSGGDPFCALRQYLRRLQEQGQLGRAPACRTR